MLCSSVYCWAKSLVDTQQQYGLYIIRKKASGGVDIAMETGVRPKVRSLTESDVLLGTPGHFVELLIV